MTGLDACVGWNDRMLARVHPRRHDKTAMAPTANPSLWGALHVAHARYLPAMERGLAQVDAPRATLVRRVLELLPARAADGLRGELDVEVEAVLGVALGVTRRACYLYSWDEQDAAQRQVEPLVAAWVEHAGLDFAVQAVVASAHWEMTRAPVTHLADYFASLVVTLERPQPHLTRCDAAAFLALRKAVSVADDAQYARGRAAALAIRERLRAEVGDDFTPVFGDEPLALRRRGALWLRCMLSCAFPDEPWWEDDLTAAGTCSSWTWLDVVAPLAATVRGERALAFAERALALQPGLLLGYLPTFVYNVGAAADQPLIRLLAQASGKDLEQGLCEVLALIETPRVAQEMASLLTHRHCRAIASQYFTRVPRLAAPALLPLSEGPGEKAEAARLLLGRLARSVPDQLASSVVDAQRAAVEALCAPRVEAGLDELPRVLAAPPWVGARGRCKRAPVVTSIPPPSSEEGMAWRPHERETLLKGRDAHRDAHRKSGVSVNVDSFEAEGKANDLFALYLLEDEAAARRLLEALPPDAWTVPPHYANQTASLAAAFELALLPVLLLWAEQRLAEMVPVLARYASPRVAPALARALAQLRTVRADQAGYWEHRTQPTRPLVHRWLLEHPRQAVAGLLPVAVGPLGPARDACESALRFLAAQGHEPLIRATAEPCGAASAVDELLGFDPLLAFPERLPRKPSFWKAAELPPPTLAASGHALPLSAVEHLGTMLSFSALSPPYAGLAEVRAACDPASLDAFTWSLFQMWMMDGAPARDSWPMFALAWLGSDDMARRLAPLLKAWPREGGQARAVLGLDVLAQIGSDVALRVLFGIAERGRKALKEKARQRLDELARLRGLSADDLADRLVPDFDLEEDGSCTLDYGPRQFRVGFDDDLRPYVQGGDGARHPDLPPPRADDDRDLAEVALEQWKQLKRDARKVFTEQGNRLEAALVGERRWPIDEFRNNLLGHPLLGHLVRRLVWGVFDGDALRASFMVRDGGALEDAEERPVHPSDEARIGLVHPLHLATDQVEAWSRLLTDYEIVQPFPQMGRTQKRLKEGDRAAKAVTHLVGRTTTVPRLLGLERRGWRKGPMHRARHTLTQIVVGCEKVLQGGAVLARLVFSPGYELGSNQGTVTLGQLEFRAVVAGRYGEAGLVPLGDLSPVAWAEVMADLETLKASR